jgi:transposase
MDTSKQFFQLHGVDAQERVVLKKKLKRKEMLALFAKLAPTVVGIEACGAAHHWARTLKGLGHAVKIMPPQYVKPYVKRGKNDAADAEALCEAMSRPSMRFVPVKSVDAQAALMLAGVRDLLIRQRTQVSNAIRGHAAEFGLVAACGLDKIAPLLERIAADASTPALARALFCELGESLAALEERIARADAALMAYFKRDRLSRRLAELPSVGPLGAVLLPLKTPDPHSFKSGRHFAAWLGLTPKDHSTAGKQRLGGITRAGDEGLRAVLVAGATSVIKQVKAGRRRWPWLERLLARKPAKLAAVALANKIARAAWKLMTSEQAYDPARLMRAA